MKSDRPTKEGKHNRYHAPRRGKTQDWQPRGVRQRCKNKLRTQQVHWECRRYDKSAGVRYECRGALSTPRVQKLAIRTVKSGEKKKLPLEGAGGWHLMR